MFWLSNENVAEIMPSSSHLVSVQFWYTRKNIAFRSYTNEKQFFNVNAFLFICNFENKHKMNFSTFRELNK